MKGAQEQRNFIKERYESIASMVKLNRRGHGNMKTAIITFDNGDRITTGINGTDDEIREYYSIGKTFNLGDGPKDLMAKVVSLEIK